MAPHFSRKQASTTAATTTIEIRGHRDTIQCNRFHMVPSSGQ
jgi:hypothetical protein